MKKGIERRKRIKTDLEKKKFFVKLVYIQPKRSKKISSDFVISFLEIY